MTVAVSLGALYFYLRPAVVSLMQRRTRIFRFLWHVLRPALPFICFGLMKTASSNCPHISRLGNLDPSIHQRCQEHAAASPCSPLPPSHTRPLSARLFLPGIFHTGNLLLLTPPHLSCSIAAAPYAGAGMKQRAIQHQRFFNTNL